jgi:hypothetical protein
VDTVKEASRPWVTAPSGPSVAPRCGRRRVVRREADRGCTAVADVVFVLLTLAVFGLLALAVRGVEKL